MLAFTAQPHGRDVFTYFGEAGEMKARFFRKLVVVAIGCLTLQTHLSAQNPSGGPAQSANLATSKDKPGQISGRVIRSDTGAPLRKAVVTLWRAAQPRGSFSVRTDSSGLYAFNQVEPGIYRLRAQRSGFVSRLYGQQGSGPGATLTLEPGRNLQDIVFRLEPAGTISGTVYDEDQDPVEGHTVSALRLRFFPGGRRKAEVLRSTVTDDRGDYRLPSLTPGAYLVQAGGRGETIAISTLTSAFSYASAYYPDAVSQSDASQVQVGSGREARHVDIFVRSTPTFTVSGGVVDPNPGGAGRQYSVGFARAGGTAMISAEADGSFVLRGLEPGEYTLVARVADEGKPARQGFARIRVVDSDVRVLIETGSAVDVSGKARFESEGESAFHDLRLLLVTEADGDAAGSASLGNSGEFVIRNAPPGRYFFQLVGRPHELYLQRVVCGGEDLTAKAVTLERGKNVDDCSILLSSNVGEVAGQVLNDHKPADGLVVALIPREPDRRKNPRHTMVAQADANGQFQMKGVIPGDYFAFAVPPFDDASYYDLEFADRNRESAEHVTVKTKESVTISLKPTRPL